MSIALQSVSCRLATDSPAISFILAVLASRHHYLTSGTAQSAPRIELYPQRSEKVARNELGYTRALDFSDKLACKSHNIFYVSLHVINTPMPFLVISESQQSQ